MAPAHSETGKGDTKMAIYSSDLVMNIDAVQRFEQTRLQARLNRFRAVLTHKSVALQDFSAVATFCGPPNSYSAGIKTVPIEQIRGSEGRSEDFDRHFNPTHARTANRWISVYTAWLDGTAMPAVELVQVGDSYYVRDGHHRISVARALGLHYIDAQVTVLETAECPLNAPLAN